LSWTVLTSARSLVLLREALLSRKRGVRPRDIVRSRSNIWNRDLSERLIAWLLQASRHWELRFARRLGLIRRGSAPPSGRRSRLLGGCRRRRSCRCGRARRACFIMWKTTPTCAARVEVQAVADRDVEEVVD
jgi:hypothetical protein